MPARRAARSVASVCIWLNAAGIVMTVPSGAEMPDSAVAWATRIRRMSALHSSGLCSIPADLNRIGVEVPISRLKPRATSSGAVTVC
jgi:hypothetical protein